MTLYGYWRSSAAYRVRIALNLLGLEHKHHSVHLVQDGGQQHHDDYVTLNPTHLVPTLIDDELILSQSLAIIEYLDEKYGSHQLLSSSLEKRAQIRALAQDIACDIHPLNNLRVVQHLGHQAEFNANDKAQWMNHWMGVGFKALESKLQQTAGQFCVGDKPTLADICLIPQMYNARRFSLDLSAFPTLERIEKNCLALSAFDLAVPENQADAS
ncbi:maleylacetoacetate isomerase [Alteromonadales bacterium alter-6D02]|nr:maleylacetoacetate isomerase [Alteromonadales bacterium alter-6D02]